MGKQKEVESFAAPRSHHVYQKGRKIRDWEARCCHPGEEITGGGRCGYEGKLKQLYLVQEELRSTVGPEKGFVDTVGAELESCGPE